MHNRLMTIKFHIRAMKYQYEELHHKCAELNEQYAQAKTESEIAELWDTINDTAEEMAFIEAALEEIRDLVNQLIIKNNLMKQTIGEYTMHDKEYFNPDFLSSIGNDDTAPMFSWKGYHTYICTFKHKIYFMIDYPDGDFQGFDTYEELVNLRS